MNQRLGMSPCPRCTFPIRSSPLHASDCPVVQGRCQWCGIVLTRWERLLGFFYLGHCRTCRAALGRDDPSPPMPYLGRYTFCRKYLSDHDDYCAGHHSEAYP